MTKGFHFAIVSELSKQKDQLEKSQSMGRLRKVSLEIHKCVHKAKKNNNEKAHDKATPAPMEKKIIEN